MTLTNPTNRFLAVDANLRTAMRFFGDATGSGEIAQLDGIVAIYSGLDYGVFNIALLTAPVEDSKTFEERMRETALFFQKRTMHWSFWLCHDLLSHGERAATQRFLGHMGLRSISSPPGMLAEQLAPPIPRLPPIELRPVVDDATRQTFGQITSLCFEIPGAIARRVYIPERAWRGAYQGFVGYAYGRPVAMVATVVESGTLGIYSLGTHPEYRRRGYGEATMRAAIEEVKRTDSIDRLVLQSTEAGYPLYRRMGFRDITRFTVYLTR